MTPAIRRAALRAAARTALVAALGGCGGTQPAPMPHNTDPPPPEQSTKPTDDDRDAAAIALAQQTLDEAQAKLSALQPDLERLDREVSAAVDAVVAAQNDTDRAAAKARLEAVRKDKHDLEQRLAEAKAAAVRAGHAVASVSCIRYLDTLARGKALPVGDPLRGKPGVYGAFSDPRARAAAETQRCCTEELSAYGADSKHRWECCSALPAVPPDAEPSACTPWGPPCPPSMPT